MARTKINNAQLSISTDLVPASANGAALGSATYEWSDLFLADSSVIKFGADQDITLTHVADLALTLGGAGASTSLRVNNTASDGDVQISFQLSGTTQFSMGVEDGDSDKFVIERGSAALGSSPAFEITSAGVVAIPGTTAASSATTGALTVAGGLGVALDLYVGDDLRLLSDSAVLALGAGNDATFTHDGTTGLTIAATPISINSTGDLTLDSSTDIVLDADGADVIFKDGGTESARLTMDSTTSIELAAIGDIILDPAGNNVLPGSDSADSLGSTTGSSTIADDFASYVVTGGTDYSSTTTFVSFTGISSEMGDVLADDTITLNDGSNTWTATVAAAASATATKASSFGSILASTTLTSSTSTISPYGGGWSVALMQAVSGDALVIGTWVGTVSSAPTSTSGTLGVSYSSGADQVPNGGLTTTLIGDAVSVSSASGTLDVSAMNGGQTVSVTRATSAVAWANLYVDDIDLNGQGSISIGGTGRIDLDADDDTSIRASADDVITFEVGGADKLDITSAAIHPESDALMDLGTSAIGFNDLHLGSGGVVNFDGGDVTMTHSSNAVTVAGGTLATAALTTSTIVASGIIKTDDSTAATSTTDGSLQTDGGLSVVLDAVIGDDLILLSDSAQITFGADSEVTLAHVADSGLLMTSAVTAVPVFELKNTNADATGATLKLNKNGSSPADGDICGNIDFASEDDASNAHTFARINATIDDASSGAEQGGLDFYVAEYDGTLTKGLQIQGTNANGIIDVTLGAGATSTTTVAGHLTVTGTTTTINSTVLTVADDLITVSKGNDTVANADGSGMEIDVTGGTNLFWKYVHSNTALSSNVDIDAASGKAYKIAGTSVLNATTLGSGVTSSSLTTIGTIGTGVWNGTAVASAYLDADTAHLSTTQTFTGAKTFTADITAGVDGTGVDVKFFGDTAGAYGLWDQSADKFIVRGPTGTGTATPGVMRLETAELTVVDGDQLGRIEFIAPLEGSGTDAITVGASIWAEADDTFAADVNDTDLIFATGKSAAATEKMRLNSDGDLAISGDLTVSGGNITNAITFDTSITLASGATCTAILDEDGMGTDSATALATQQSIKAYVDATVTASDLDLTTDSGTIDIADSETLTITGGEGIDTSASGTTVTIACEDATSSNKGVASFGNGLQVSSGAVTIDSIKDTYLSSSITTGTVATLTGTPLESAACLVFLNGMLQTISGSAGTTFDYTLSGQTLTLTSAMDSDDVLIAQYIKQ